MTVLTEALTELQRARTQEIDEIDKILVARLSAFPEEQVLNWFWLMVRGGANRFRLLLQLTNVTIQRPASWKPEEIRAAHEAQTDPVSTAIIRRCFACDSGDRLYRHHVIEVHHGGSNTSRNKVPLCFDCHQFVHPWLKEEPYKPSRAGWESFTDVAQRFNPEQDFGQRPGHMAERRHRHTPLVNRAVDEERSDESR